MTASYERLSRNFPIRNIRKHVWIGRLYVPLPLSLAKQLETIATRVGRYRYDLAMGSPEERQIWLNSHDKLGRYRHWSGFWESQTGWIFDETDGHWHEHDGDE